MDKEMEALNKFREQYPNSTSGDLQTFVLGYQAAAKSKNEEIENPFEKFPDNAFIQKNIKLKHGKTADDVIAYLKGNKNFGIKIERCDNEEICFTINWR